MARKATPTNGFSSLYVWLLDREEDAGRRVGSPPGSYDGRPERLAALRAGESVDLPAGDLPRWAIEGVEYHWWVRAIVDPDGSVEFAHDTGQWARENGV